MDYRELVGRAIALAVEAHAGQVGKEGDAYILHPLRLLVRAKSDEERIVAVLHDTIEDTYLTMERLEREGFPPPILQALDCVTRRDGEGYDRFIERIAENPLAVRVKLLDLYDNIDLTRLIELTDRDLERAAKYHRAIRRLQSIPVD